MTASDARFVYSLTNEFDVLLLNVLDQRQSARLEQIQLQADGPMAFTRPQIQERLNLAPEQVEEISGIVSQGRDAIDKAARVPASLVPATPRLSPELRRSLLQSKDAKRNIESSRERVSHARQATLQSIAKVLTREQRKVMENMLGAPFDFEKTSRSTPRSQPARPSASSSQP